MQQGYIKLHRCILDSSWSRQPDFIAVWVYCLLRANYQAADVVTKGGMIVHLEPGQFITSRQQISINTGVQESKVERILKVFKSEQQIEQEGKGKFRVISILNWAKYQISEQQDEQHLNNKRTTNEHKQEGEEGEEGKEEVKTPPSSGDEAGADTDVLLTKRKRKLSGKRLEAFNQFWDAFDYKRGKAEAADAWLDIPELNNRILAQIIAAAGAEAKARPSLIAKNKTPKMAQGWLSGRRWEDETKQQKRGLTDDFEKSFLGTS